MKLLACAAALLCAAVAVAAAPALSTTPYRPKAVDFELSAPPASVAAARGGRLVSETLRSGRRFNLVGMRWRGRAEARVAIRARPAGKGWTPWTRLDTQPEDGPDVGSGEGRRGVTVSAPAWVGEADELQYRLSRRVPGLRLHFVNVRGTATPGARRLTALRNAANTAFVSAGRFLGAAPATAQEPQPELVTRSAWGASQCPPRSAPSYGSVKAAFVHHTVNANDYTTDEAPDVVLAICRYHRNSNGWNDIGYNFLVDRYGTLYEGRAGGVNQPVVGAQAQGYNTASTGIANIGTFETEGQTPEALDAMVRLIRWKLPLHGAPTGGRVTIVSEGGASNRYPAGRAVSFDRISGHRDGDATECPGDGLYAQLPDLRAMAAGASPPAGTSTVLSGLLDTEAVTYSRTVAYTGLLRAVSGVPAGGQVLQVQSRRSSGWRTTRRIRTAADGTFSTAIKPRVNSRVRVRFPGGAGLRASVAGASAVRVRPLLALTYRPTVATRGRRRVIKGTVTPRKRVVYLVLQQDRGGRYRRVGVSAWRTSRGRFRVSFVPASTGRYRYYLVSKADALNDRGSSKATIVRVR